MDRIENHSWIKSQPKMNKRRQTNNGTNPIQNESLWREPDFSIHNRFRNGEWRRMCRDQSHLTCSMCGCVFSMYREKNSYFSLVRFCSFTVLHFIHCLFCSLLPGFFLHLIYFISLHLIQMCKFLSERKSVKFSFFFNFKNVVKRGKLLVKMWFKLSFWWNLLFCLLAADVKDTVASMQYEKIAWRFNMKRKRTSSKR